MFKKFFDDKLPDRYEIFSSLRDKCIFDKNIISMLSMFRLCLK